MMMIVMVATMVVVTMVLMLMLRSRQARVVAARCPGLPYFSCCCSYTQSDQCSVL